MTDPARVRYLIQHYPQLQGLRLIPLGFLFVTVALWHDGQLRWLPGSTGDGATRWFIAGLAVAIAASYGIGVYYRERFGAVQLGPFQTGGLRITVVGAVILVSLALQDAFKWPFSVPLLVVGALLAYIGVVQRRMRQYYLWIAAACLVMANIADFGVPPQTRQVMLDLLIAGGLFVAGIGDHLVLRKALHPPEPSAHVHTAV
jgi:hypothetical protein